MRGHRGGDFLPGDISNELGTTLENLGHKAAEGVPLWEKWSEPAVCPSQSWLGGMRAVRGRAQGPLFTALTSARNSPPWDPPSLPSPETLGCSSHTRWLFRPSHPPFTWKPGSSHHTMGSLKGLARGPGAGLLGRSCGHEGLCQGESE